MARTPASTSQDDADKKMIFLALLVAASLSLQPSSAVFFHPGCNELYHVEAGDSCYSVAVQFGLSLQELLTLNPALHCTTLTVGRALCVGPQPQLSSCGKLHNLEAGETCSSISKAWGISPSAFTSVNPNLNCSDLPTRVGQPVCVSTCSSSSRLINKPMAKNWKKKVLIDYLGAVGGPISLQSVPRRDTVDQVLALSFLLDADDKGNVQNGIFRPNWVETITPAAVQAFKAEHPGVRVIASLAGYSQYVSANDTRLIKWYNPKDEAVWVRNAVDSLTNLSQTYHLDGIDIDYENFTQSSTFPSAMGEVIKTLKQRRTISLVTVAPYNLTIVPYTRLLAQYGVYIDYVNYQFYGTNHTSVEAYVEDYNRIARKFPREKLLPSTEIGPGGRGLQGQDFFSAVDLLHKQSGSIPGMFLWSAEASQRQDFAVERVFQCNY